ncbi:hypothetical protein [Halorarum salinum]|uniref:Uncharacterized protein n=1 Tax=Halorarum salinum TaxID=2743089 RepID=A0A7D5LAP1_9EURY|nr:hypothetical protein [Halobaculum salinum]QLG62212.1 hypothetical protein HUG12_10905 [Halobaculum salinum]
MDDSELIEAVSRDLFAYVLDGELPEDDIAELIKPADFPEQYADYDRLVSLHFLLRQKVQDFVESLPDDIRSIKTETTTEANVQREGVDGRINWESTYQARATTSPKDSGLHVIESQTEQYNIPENIVLKALVNLIDGAIGDVDRYLDSNRSWVTESWVGEERTRERFQTLVERNIHLQRIPSPTSNAPTPRMLTRAQQSRRELYRTAGSLLAERRAYDSSKSAIQSLLQETTITPSGSQTLFELFTLFRVLDGLRNVGGPEIGKPTYHTLASGRTAAATYDGDRGLNVFYNQTPDDPSIEFKSLPDEEPATARSDIALRTATQIADAYFTDTDVRQHTNRPDVLITTDDNDPPSRSYLIVEVKYSTNKQTIRQGIREIVEYISYLRRDGNYPFKSNEFGTGLNGLLVVQDLDDSEIEPASLAQQSREGLPVRIVQAKDLDAVLPSLIRRTFLM